MAGLYNFLERAYNLKSLIEADIVVDKKLCYVKGDYEMLNYFLDFLSIELPKNTPSWLIEYTSEGIFYMNEIEKRVFKEELKEEFNYIFDDTGKQVFFMIFCDCMRSFYIYKEEIMRYAQYGEFAYDWWYKEGFRSSMLYYEYVAAFIYNQYNFIHKGGDGFCVSAVLNDPYLRAKLNRFIRKLSNK